MTEFNTDWDVEKYKQDHEIDEHWELKKAFLEAHKDRFPEDELVCLAQVFVNVELLGCRYPDETMKIVAELSEDIAEEFRSKRKSKLQRTFVQASDAASSKVKGLKNTPNSSMNQSQSSLDESFEDQTKGKNTKKRLHDTITSDESDEEIPYNNKRTKNEPVAPYGKMVLFDHVGDAPPGVLTRAANAYGIKIDWKYNDEGHCTIFMNNKIVGQSSLPNKKQSKTEAAVRAVEELKKYYYTIKVHPTSTDIETVSCNSLRSQPEKNSVVESNIGNKLMKLMGWTGGGLGKTQQGIVEPVSASIEPQMCRKGLGLNSQKSDLIQLKKKCKELVSDFLKSDKQDLIFSSDFTKEERATMHEVAKQMGIKSHSHGSATNRKLIFTKKIDPEELIAELKAIGGKTGKYELIYPTEEQ